MTKLTEVKAKSVKIGIDRPTKMQYIALVGDAGAACMSQDALTRVIGERVRAARAARSMTRKQLARAADVSERYLNELENGVANVSVGVLSRVAHAVSTDMITLLRTDEHAIAHGALTANFGVQGRFADLVGGMSPRELEDAVPILERYLAERRRCLRGVALLGLRGAGKTTIGSLFAARHGLPFISVTREIENRAGMPLNDLFNLGGPDAYRSMENEVVNDLASRNQRIVLETAGGIVANSPALDVILGAFKTVWLKASPQEHLDRVVKQGDMRPMQGMPTALEHLKTLLARREQEYGRADCILDTTGRAPAECVEELELIAGGAVRPA